MQKVQGNIRSFQLNGISILWALCALEGVVALVGSLLAPSEPGSTVLLGLSPVRLVITGVTSLLIAVFVLLVWSTINRSAGWQRAANLVERVSQSPARVFAIFAGIFALFLVLVAVLGLCISPASHELTLLKTVYCRVGPLLAWGAVVLFQVGAALLFFAQTRAPLNAISIPLRAGVLLAVVTGVYTVFLKVFLALTWDTRLKGVEGYIFLPALVLLLWGTSRLIWQKTQRFTSVETFFMLLFIGTTVSTVYWHSAQWAQFEGTRTTFTWHLVAQSFLEGKLYLENPPSHHDMTLYKGHWYVPNPPLPALVLMPLIALLGIEKLNMVHFSILCGALNAVVVYAMLSKASALKFIPTSTAGNLWLTALFAFGTTHWWLSVYGIYWYLSQILTITFAGLAVLLALNKASPWFIGLCLGTAILSRPNVFTLWPLLAGITLYLEQPSFHPIPWKKMFFWAAQTAVPVTALVGALLFYNFLRFENFLDFGYTTINSSTWIMEAVQTYGMFNLHFLPVNFYVMFLKMPTIAFENGAFRYSPGFEGTSILAMTPATLYLFRRFRVNGWTVGAWASVLLTAGLLLFYHNTGSWQIGYRYLMDFILPALLLIAVGVGSRTSRVFVFLMLLSILINGAGVNWWFTNM